MSAEQKQKVKVRAVELLRAALASGRSPSEMAAAVGVSTDALGRYLTGSHYPRPKVAERIVAHLSKEAGDE